MKLGGVPIPDWLIALVVMSAIAWLAAAAYIVGDSIRAHAPPLYCSKPFIQNGVRIVICAEAVR